MRTQHSSKSCPIQRFNRSCHFCVANFSTIASPTSDKPNASTPLPTRRLSLSYVSAADDDNYTTLKHLPKPQLSLEAVVVVYKSRKTNNNSHLPDQLPTPKTLSLDVAVTEDYATASSASTSDEPPRIEEVCAHNL
jgi:hypothetical protein